MSFCTTALTARTRTTRRLWFGVAIVIALAMGGVGFLLPSGEDYTYHSTARAVDFERRRDVLFLERAIDDATTLFNTPEHRDMTVCLGCPHVGVGLQCVVWPNGTAWANPVIVERRGSVKGKETSALHPEAGEVEKVRSARVVVKYWMNGGGKQSVLHGVEAACVEHMVDIFSGVPFSAPALGERQPEPGL